MFEGQARLWGASPWRTGACILVSVVIAAAIFAALLGIMAVVSEAGRPMSLAVGASTAAPIPPPEGFPKLKLSTKAVTPTLAPVGGVSLTYKVEIRNTGTTTATNTTLIDALPEGVVYSGDAWASHGSPPQVLSDTLIWTGEVGFDTTVVVTFSVSVQPAFIGTIRNTAVITDPRIAKPVTVTAETVVTDEPSLVLAKDSSPEKPGANKPLYFELQVTNRGQPATNVPITVTDRVPSDTVLRSIGPDGFTGVVSDVVTWTRSISLDLGQSTFFTFAVDINDVDSGTVIANEDYAVAAPFGFAAGELYTITVIDPILSLAKRVWPDPPGSNREMTYTITVLNVGSLATDLVVSDRIPAGVTYLRGGVGNSGIVSWSLSNLNSGDSADFTFTVGISDVMNLPILNDSYSVCSAEGVCAAGESLTSVIEGPVFEAHVYLDPIAHKPGGGTGTEVTPTLVVHNVGAGSAIDAQATLLFERLSVSANDLVVVPPTGSPFERGPACGDNCKSYYWVGPLDHGDTVTFTTSGGQSTIGGEPGTHYTATVIITDAMANMTTHPVTGTAYGTVTHMANVQPVKMAVPVIGAGQRLTYTIEAYNRGLSTALPPVLTDVVPLSTTLVWASDGGMSLTVSDTMIVSWTLPLLSPGEGVVRRFAVLVDSHLLSGTQIVNRDYSVYGYGNVLTGTVTSGPPVTTTVKEVGLIDSYKTVTPQLVLPGAGNVLTYEIHLVNSSALPLSGVRAYDLLPWASSTYRRDAVASSGELVSDVISIDWMGGIDAFSEEVVTASVLVDADFNGALTNTVVISHPNLVMPVERHAVAYVTDQPVLFIRKSATPDPVALGKRLTYRLSVSNLGQPATHLLIMDAVPSNVTYVPDTATAGGDEVDDAIHWLWPVLESAEGIAVSFQVTVEQGTQVANAWYGVRSSEGVSAMGPEVVTQIKGGGLLYLPLVLSRTP